MENVLVLCGILGIFFVSDPFYQFIILHVLNKNVIGKNLQTFLDPLRTQFFWHENTFEERKPLNKSKNIFGETATQMFSFIWNQDRDL